MAFYNVNLLYVRSYAEMLKPCSLSVLMILLLFGVVGCHEQAATENEDSLKVLDFRHVVSQARDKVFPTVVYIKCIRQSHEGARNSLGKLPAAEL
jgi:hypothetical protein